MPISCFGIDVDDSIEGIAGANSELMRLSSQACLNNGDVARILEAQYNKDPKRTVGQYFYYTLFKEETENVCTIQT